MVSAATKREQFRPVATRIAIRRGLRVPSIPVVETGELRTLTVAEAEDLRAMLRHDRYAKLAAEECELLARAEKPGISWSGIIEWLKTHWQEILRILLAILPLFLLSPA